MGHADALNAAADMAAGDAALSQSLYESLALLLDQVDYKAGACNVSEMVGACLDAKVLDRVREVAERARAVYGRQKGVPA
jgi:hypothetical protein